MTRRRAGEEMRESKLGWIGDIPADWSLVPTKQVLKLVKRTVGDRWADHQLLSLTKQGVIARNMESNHGKFPESFDTYQAVLPGELIFCLFDVDETPRTVGLATQSGMVTGAYDCFQTNPTLDHRFASWYFIAIDDGKRFRPLYSGLRKVVPKPRFLSAGFALPSLKEQRQIADYLDVHTAEIDALIGKQERLIETLAERRQAVISHAVTKGLDPNAPMKDSGTTWLGRIPEEWIAVRLKHLASVQTGLTLGKVVPADEAIELPYLRVANVQTSGVNLDEIKTVLVDRSEWERYRLRDGDVLMTEGGDIDKLGRGCLWSNQIDPCVHQNHVFAVRCSAAIYSRLLVYLLDAQVARNYFRLTAKKTTNLASTNSTTLGNLPIALPQLREQVEIVAQLDRETAQIDALSAKAREMIDVLKERRQALISAAVTGKIDVRGLS